MACRRADHTGEKRADIAMNYIQGNTRHDGRY
jgi:hypothetical protein